MKIQRAYFERLSAVNQGSLNVVVVCDSFKTGTTAMDVYDSFIAQFGDALLFQRHLFDFHNIADPHSTQRTLNLSAGADVIILASERKEIPTYIETWLAMVALARNGRSGALIALIANDAPGCIAENLESVAQQACLDFFRMNLLCPFASHEQRCRWCFPWGLINAGSQNDESTF